MSGEVFVDLLATAEARKSYFLSGGDLSQLNFRSIQRCQGGPGAPKRYYSAADLQATAIHKYGPQGFQDKILKQERRLNERRQRLSRANDEANAEYTLVQKALENELQQESQPPATRAPPRYPVVESSTVPPIDQSIQQLRRDAIATSATGNASAKEIRFTVEISSSGDEADSELCPPAEPAEYVLQPEQTATLRQSLLKLAKKALCLTDRRSTQSWRVDVSGIQPSAFAALTGCPSPAQAAHQPFKIARTSEALMRSCVLFGCAQVDLLHVFYREGVGIQIADNTVLKYDPSVAMLTLLGEGRFVCDERTMWL